MSAAEEIVKTDFDKEQIMAKIEQLFSQLGQQYYEDHKDDESSEQRDLIMEINKLYAEIREEEERIRREEEERIRKEEEEKMRQEEEKLLAAKGLKKCPHCGKAVTQDVIFCGYCGIRFEESPVEEETAEEGRFCPNCHTALEEDEIFCHECGTRCVSESGTAAESGPAPEALHFGEDTDSSQESAAVPDKPLSFEQKPESVEAVQSSEPDPEPVEAAQSSEPDPKPVEETQDFSGISRGLVEELNKNVQQEEQKEPDIIPMTYALRFCRFCGTKLEEGSAFCYECGAKVK